jgi:hypothetical protein
LRGARICSKAFHSAKGCGLSKERYNWSIPAAVTERTFRWSTIEG